jgi:hypothetical protein
MFYVVYKLLMVASGFLGAGYGNSCLYTT